MEGGSSLEKSTPNLKNLATTIEGLAAKHGLEYYRKAQSPQGKPEIWVTMQKTDQTKKVIGRMNVRVTYVDNQPSGTIYVDGSILMGPNRAPFGNANLPLAEIETFVQDKIGKMVVE